MTVETTVDEQGRASIDMPAEISTEMGPSLATGRLSKHETHLVCHGYRSQYVPCPITWMGPVVQHGGRNVRWCEIDITPLLQREGLKAGEGVER